MRNEPAVMRCLDRYCIIAAERLREAATRDLLDAAESEAGLGELAYGRLEYRTAAQNFRGAAELLFGR